jgi:glucose-1-phosphate thymidylyltransferase
MKGVVLAGGTGSRLRPLTEVTNKHLLPVGKHPMIYHPISKLVQAGIDDIVVVTGIDHVEDVVRLLENEDRWDVSFGYRIQKRAGGIADALGLAEDFVGHEKMIVILGDNIFDDRIDDYVSAYENQPSGARIMLKEVDEPERFGVPAIEGDRITEIYEKPDEPPTSYCVTGLYMYDSQVFEFIDNIEPSDRGELEITDVNNLYIEHDQLKFDVFDSWWTDAGTLSSYRRANELVWE